MESSPETEEAPLDPTQLLNLAQTHLRLRNFSLSRQYSLELLSSSFHRRSLRLTATQTLTISDILSAAAATNHYSILQLDSFSNDHNLIRAHYKNLISILDPIKHSSPLAQQALDFAHRAFTCLSDPYKKSVFDTELRKSMGGGNGGFWTFCPYCYYVYQYDRVYEGCCLRCQNFKCKRVFHGVALTDLAKKELDKGSYFGCFGYFPIGFEGTKEGGQEMGMFESWSPFVGVFPGKRRNADGAYDGTNLVEILDESDECDSGDNGGNVPSVDRDKPPGMRRKSVALNAKRRRSNEGDNAADVSEEFDLENDDAVGDGGGGIVGDLNEGDMTFFKDDGEIFVDLGADE